MSEKEGDGNLSVVSPVFGIVVDAGDMSDSLYSKCGWSLGKSAHLTY